MEKADVLTLPAGRELDKMVAEMCMGWDSVRVLNHLGEDGPVKDDDWFGCPVDGVLGFLQGHRTTSFDPLPYFSTSSVDVRPVEQYVRKQYSGKVIDIFDGEEDYPSKITILHNNVVIEEVDGFSLPLALCRLALIATGLWNKKIA